MPYYCTVCGEKCKNRAAMSSHQWIHRKQNKNKNVEAQAELVQIPTTKELTDSELYKEITVSELLDSLEEQQSTITNAIFLIKGVVEHLRNKND